MIAMPAWSSARLTVAFPHRLVHSQNTKSSMSDQPRQSQQKIDQHYQAAQAYMSKEVNEFSG
jgi:hypothetical protein